MNILQSPATLGFRMPAEWEKQEAIWLAWPYDPITFPDRVEKAEKTFIEIITAIHPHERVELLVRNAAEQGRVEKLLSTGSIDLNKVRFHAVDYADVWTRDYAPSFVVNARTGQIKAVKWSYDAYSKKFPDLLKDSDVFRKLAPELSMELIESGIVMEGGAIEVNGQGTLLTTEQCLMKRHPNLSKTDWEKIFADYLGVKRVIWFKEGIVNDHTDGHIDEVARFVSPNKIVCAYEDNPADENYEILKINYRILQSATDQDGKPFEIIKLPMPHLRYDDGRKAPASYTNFYIGNKVVLVGTFGDSNDAKALAILQDIFFTRRVVSIDCRDIIYGGGGVHCMTREQPL